MTKLSTHIQVNQLVDNIERLPDIENLIINKGFYLHIMDKNHSFFIHVDEAISFMGLINSILGLDVSNFQVHTIPAKKSGFVWERNQCKKNKVSELLKKEN